MAHDVAEHADLHMGLPLPNGKLALWIFLVTEITFFTALIGTYMLLRSGQPTAATPWPAPHEVHLSEFIGAFNTFVLICSSLTVVLCHWFLHEARKQTDEAAKKSRVTKATLCLAITLLLGLVFLGVKAFEYKAKIEHGILPGRVFELKTDANSPQNYAFLRHVDKQLDHIIEDPVHAGAVLKSESVTAWTGFRDAAKKSDKELQEKLKKLDDDVKAKKITETQAKEDAEKLTKTSLETTEAAAKKLADATDTKDLWAVVECWRLKQVVFQLSPKEANERIVGTEHMKEKQPGKEEMKTKRSFYCDLPEKSKPARRPVHSGHPRGE